MTGLGGAAATPPGGGLAISIIRTVTPAAAGLLIAWGVRQGIPGAGGARGPLTEVLTAVFTAAWYAVARLLEHYVSGRFGWLLGAPRPPVYPSTAPAAGLHAAGSPPRV